MRLPMLRTTPGEMVRCRGTGVVWAPQGQPHLVCGPDSESTRQPWARSARSTSRSFMDGTTPRWYAPAGLPCPPRVDNYGCVPSPDPRRRSFPDAKSARISSPNARSPRTPDRMISHASDACAARSRETPSAR